MFTLDTFVYPLIGGILIGLASLGMLLFNGRIAGISGIFGGLLKPSKDDVLWRVAFVAGLLVAGTALAVAWPARMPSLETVPRSAGALIVAGLLVGFGSRLGAGCTSGHGVCGISRLSVRSITATLTFMATGAITVFLVRVIFGGVL